MALTEIRIELASRGGKTSDEAMVALDCLKDPLYHDYIFNVGSHPAIIAVGYVGDLAVTAASCYERVMTARPSDDESKAPFVGVPHLQIDLFATLSMQRRHGFGNQLVGSILNLATGHEFDRVEASQPSGDDAKMFWGSCGFTFLPFASFGDYDMYRSTKDVPLQDVGVEVTVSSEVHDRLSSFSEAQAAS